MSLPDKPLLCIGKENICHAYGCSCMDFLVHRRVSEDTQIQIDGHITDRDEITELVKITIKISDGVVNSRQEDFIGINEAMQEVRDAMSVLQVPEHTPTR